MRRLLLTALLALLFGATARADVAVEAFALPAGGGYPHDVAVDAEGKAWYTAQRSGQLGRLDSASGKPWVSFVPDVQAEKVPEYFSDFSQTFGHNLCPVAWYFAQVEPDGEVCFCGDFPDYFIGNVRKRPFREIWTGEKAQKFREKLAKEPLPICARCCGNYVYGKWRRPQGVAIPSEARDPTLVVVPTSLRSAG